MQYIIDHTVLDFTWWDVPALLVLIAVVVLFVVKNHKAKREESELEEQLAAVYVKDVDETIE